MDERRLPSPLLAGGVDHLWQVSDSPAHARERILPNGTLELVFNLAEDEVRIYDGLTGQPCRRLSGSVVSGVFSRFFVIDTREHACMVGVHFKPGGAWPFLRRLPLLELADAHVDLATLWGSKAARLRERLALTPTSRERFQLLEAALLEELGSGAAAHRAVSPAIRALGSSRTSIADVAAKANLSHRRFIELFSLEVGTTPKVFQRLQRFQRALTLARESAGAAGACSGGAQVAQLAGYFDQSHWIRDCSSLSGMTPSEYSKQWTTQVKEGHVPLVRGSGG